MQIFVFNFPTEETPQFLTKSNLHSFYQKEYEHFFFHQVAGYNKLLFFPILLVFISELFKIQRQILITPAFHPLLRLPTSTALLFQCIGSWIFNLNLWKRLKVCRHFMAQIIDGHKPVTLYFGGKCVSQCYDHGNDVIKCKIWNLFVMGHQ